MIEFGSKYSAHLINHHTTAAIGMKSLGKIAPGYDANLVIVDGEYFDPKSKILSVWVNGKNTLSHQIIVKISRTWSLKYNGTYELTVGK